MATHNPRLSVTDLLTMSRRQLHQTLMGGYAIDERELDDCEFKGISLGVPAWVDRLTWKKFKKVFHRDSRTGHLRGWNIRVEQNDLAAPCVPLRRGTEMVTFGHYGVVAAADRSMPWPVRQGLMMDYGLGGNRRFDPLSRLRDPIVAVNEGSSDLILGYMFVSLGRLNVLTPSYFLLQKEGPLLNIVEPPRRRGLPELHGE